MSSRVILLLIVTFVNLLDCLPSEEITTRSSAIQDSRKIHTNNPKAANNVLLDILDVRTPPKIKQQQDKKKHEQSHPGVAIPIDEDSIDLVDSTTKKFNFYKLERPTTDSTISTWILLSGQPAATTKYSTSTSTSSSTEVIVPIYSRTKKPLNVGVSNNIREKIRFTEINRHGQNNKKKPTYSTSTTTSTTEIPKKLIDKIIKIDKNKTNSVISTTESTSHPYSTKTTNKNRKRPTESSIASSSSTQSLKTTTELSTVTVNETASLIEPANNTLQTNSSSIALESKDGSINLANDKKKKTTNKKKKNKRRKKPANKSSSTSIESTTKIKKKTDPLGSQIYSYLSREIVPTLGVGLVGLMVTAGLAGYFLYPFGAARRNINIDRNDKYNYYSKDEYSGGMLEEDAIGQVIAGMPSNSLYSSKSLTTKSPYLNKIYRSNNQYPIQYKQQYPKASENAALFEREDGKEHVKVNEDKNNNEVNSTRFVVGSVHKEAIEEVTPVTVPEHGPRSLRFSSNNINLKRKIKHN